MDAPLQTLAPETPDGKAVCVVVQFGGEDRWVDSIPAFLREHLIPAIPEDGKMYAARITWTIGGL